MTLVLPQTIFQIIQFFSQIDHDKTQMRLQKNGMSFLWLVFWGRSENEWKWMWLLWRMMMKWGTDALFMGMMIEVVMCCGTSECVDEKRIPQNIPFKGEHIAQKIVLLIWSDWHKKRNQNTNTLIQKRRETKKTKVFLDISLNRIKICWIMTYFWKSLVVLCIKVSRVLVVVVHLLMFQCNRLL